jgi:hypothetical protein
MTSTVALIVALVLILGAGVVWRATRRLSAVAFLKDVTVSRQWLIQHQADDRS